MGWSVKAYGAQAQTSPSSNVSVGPLDTTGADLIIMGCGDFGTLSNSPSDNKNSSNWTKAVSAGSGSTTCQLFYSQGLVVGPGHTFTMTGTYQPLFVIAFSGSTTSPLDQTNNATGSGSSIQPGSITPGFDGELLLVVQGDGGGSADTIGSGFTIPTGLQINYNAGASIGGLMAYLVQNTAAAINPTVSNSGSAGSLACVIASFKVATGGGPVNVNLLMMMGSGR